MMTPWRKFSYKKLSTIIINGVILDLGGSKNAGYHKLIQGEHTFITVDLDKEQGCDIQADLDKPFPMESNKYDAVLCMNILEHIFNYQQFLNESRRVLRDDGKFIMLVPFLIQIHPSPHDYFRFSSEALRRILELAGFHSIEIEPIGRGSFTAASQLQYNLPKFVLVRTLSSYFSQLMDFLVSFIDKKRSFINEYYPLGYFVIAKKG